jgi:hypothetical protein
MSIICTDLVFNSLKAMPAKTVGVGQPDVIPLGIAKSQPAALALQYGADLAFKR